MSLKKVCKGNSYVKKWLINIKVYLLKFFCNLFKGAVVSSGRGETDSKEWTICWAGRFSHFCSGVSCVLHRVHSRRLVHTQVAPEQTQTMSLFRNTVWSFKFSGGGGWGGVNWSVLRLSVHTTHEEESRNLSWLEMLVQRNSWGGYTSRWKGQTAKGEGVCLCVVEGDCRQKERKRIKKGNKTKTVERKKKNPKEEMRNLARELLEQQLREAGRARDNCMQEGDQTAQEQRLNLNPRAVKYRLK